MYLLSVNIVNDIFALSLSSIVVNAGGGTTGNGIGSGVTGTVDPNASATSFNNLGTTGYQCRFYFSLGFINSSISVDGQTFDLSDKIYLIDEDEILGARFLISNTTTNNWRK